MGRLAEFGWSATRRVVSVAPARDLPEGRLVRLAGRGSTYVIDSGPDDERPVLFLLHALACTGLLTWYPHLAALRRRYRVVTFDQRWHGQGIRSPRFTLEDCADDVVAVADALGVGRFVCAGYSMGSLVTQLAWHRHPERVQGAVMCASTASFIIGRRDPVAVRAVRDRLARSAVRRRRPPRLVDERSVAFADDNRWAVDQFRRTSGAEITAAAAAISRFDSTPWIGRMDVPAAVVVTARDRAVPPSRQRALARRIPHAAVYDVDAGHAAVVLSADRFRPALLAACASVTARLNGREPH